MGRFTPRSEADMDTGYAGQHFNGPAYDPGRDNARLGAQITRVYNFMKDGEWHTLAEIAEATGDPTPSVSAQLRHLRKPRFGGYTVDRHHLGDGLYAYNLTGGKNHGVADIHP